MNCIYLRRNFRDLIIFKGWWWNHEGFFVEIKAIGFLHFFPKAIERNEFHQNHKISLVSEKVKYSVVHFSLSKKVQSVNKIKPNVCDFIASYSIFKNLKSGFLTWFMEVGNTSPVWGEFTNNCINIGTHPISLYLTLRVTICW